MLPPEPRYLYSNRGYWYPQSVVTDYATARMTVSVPERLRGDRDRPAGRAAGAAAGRAARASGRGDGSCSRAIARCAISRASFRACATSRSRRMRTGDAGRMASSCTSRPIRARSARARRARPTARVEIFEFYASLVGDAPYPSLHAGVHRARDCRAATARPTSPSSISRSRSGLTWRNDPVNFDNYPAVLPGARDRAPVVGPGGRLEELPRAVAQRGVRPVLRRALCASRSWRRRSSTTCCGRCGRRRSTQSHRARSTSAIASATSRADARVFRSIIYNKAAMVLHMLRRIDRRRGVLRRGAGRSTPTGNTGRPAPSDLIKVMEKASGRDLSRFFDAWVFGESIPTVRFSHRIDGTTLVLRLEQPGRRCEFPIGVRLTIPVRPDRDRDRPGRSDQVTEQTVELTGAAPVGDRQRRPRRPGRHPLARSARPAGGSASARRSASCGPMPL